MRTIERFEILIGEAVNLAERPLRQRGPERGFTANDKQLAAGMPPNASNEAKHSVVILAKS